MIIFENEKERRIDLNTSEWIRQNLEIEKQFEWSKDKQDHDIRTNTAEEKGTLEENVYCQKQWIRFSMKDKYKFFFV